MIRVREAVPFPVLITNSLDVPLEPADPFRR